MMMNTTNYNPDVLSCLANLSNDEVFTPPANANEMLDLLPVELWQNKNATFLDPVSKSGVFLREITKRLNAGLKEQIPDQQQRVNHILTKQVFGLALTELTSLLSRRTLYCAKTANGKYSICTEFSDEQGNLFYEKTQHKFQNEKCVFCGASQFVYDRGESSETYAYPFIHENNPYKNMKFDVIIGNPPYQLNVGVEKENYAIAIYNLFVEQAKKLNPRYLTMIIPARWYSGGRGLDKFRKEMLDDDRIRIIHDFIRADDVFPSVEIKGGVCYFLWDRDNRGLCEINTHIKDKITSVSQRPLLEKNADTFIRYNEAISILRKVQEKNEISLSNTVSSQTPFGIITSFKEYKNEPFHDSVKIYLNKKVGYIEMSQIPKKQEWVNKIKVILPEAIGNGGFDGNYKPLIIDKMTCCSQTYIVIGIFDNIKRAESLCDYIQTRFFRFLVGLRKVAQHAMRDVYSFVPTQDFNESWTDEKLYKKYGLTQEEIAFIESMVRPMEL